MTRAITIDEARTIADRLARQTAKDHGDLASYGRDVDDRHALHGWIRQRMAAEVLARGDVRRAHEWPMGRGPVDWDGLPDDDHEALAHAVAKDLGGQLAEDPHGPHGLAWDLCEAAGWPCQECADRIDRHALLAGPHHANWCSRRPVRPCQDCGTVTCSVITKEARSKARARDAVERPPTSNGDQ